MLEETDKLLRNVGAELVFGLVAPVEVEDRRRCNRPRPNVMNNLLGARIPPRATRHDAATGDTMKPKMGIDDEEPRAPWETAKKAKAEVESGLA